MTTKIILGMILGGGVVGVLIMLSYLKDIWEYIKSNDTPDRKDIDEALYFLRHIDEKLDNIVCRFNEKRVEDVINKYMEFRMYRKTAGLDGLQKAGVCTLQDDEEIREAVEIIMKHGVTDPLLRRAFDIDNIDLKIFFEEATKEKLNLFKIGNVRSLIRRLKDEQRWNNILEQRRLK